MNDEALEIAARLPGVKQIQNPDRVAAAREALAADPQQVLVLDDAFQHRRIARDLEIVLLDALEPFGYEHLLPRGLLREPVSSLSRAHVVALSRADAVSESCRREIEARVRESLEAVALDVGDVMNKSRDELSGGMAKRVAIARAIAVNPAVIFYDEPTTGLDPMTASHVHELVDRVHRRPLPDGSMRTSVLFTHDRASDQTLEGLAGDVISEFSG